MDTTNSNKKFEEALHLLNEAAKEKKEEIQKLIGDKYSDIKDAIGDMAASKADELKRVKKYAKKAWSEGEDRVKEVSSDLDEKVRENPWAYLGGVALGSLLLGFIMGSSKKD